MSDVVTEIDWLKWLQFLVTVLSPFIAAIGAWLVYAAQKRHERDNELRVERQRLYVEIVAALSSATKVHEGPAYYHAVGEYLDRLRIVAPDSVVKAALKLINLDIRINLLRTKANSLDAAKAIEDATKQASLRDAREALIVEMRKDVLKGTKVSEELTRVEDLEK